MGILQMQVAAGWVIIVNGKKLYDQIMFNGGKPVFRRILDAYGFTLLKQLCELLRISSGTVRTWIRRNFFPSDVVVICALDTDISILRLATGQGDPKRERSVPFEVKKYWFEPGFLVLDGEWSADPNLFKTPNIVAEYIEGIKYSCLIDKSSQEIGNSRWLITIDGTYDFIDIARLPGENKIKE